MRVTRASRLIRCAVATTVIAASLAGGGGAADAAELNLETFRVPGGAVDVLVGPDATMWTLDDKGGLSRLTNGKGRRVTRPSNAVLTLGQLVLDGWGRLVHVTRDRRGRGVIRRVRPDGKINDVPIPGNTGPLSVTTLATGPDGTVWFNLIVAGGSSKLGTLTPSGRIRTYEYPDSPPDFSGFGGDSLAVGADGNIWFPAGKGVGRLTPNGKLVAYHKLDDDFFAGVAMLARGSDDAIWTGVNLGYVARIDPNDGSVERHQLLDGGRDSTFRYWAMEPGPGADMWALTGFESERVGPIVVDTLEPFARATGRLSKDFLYLPTFPASSEVNSPEHFGLVAGLDGRMWFTERLTHRLQAWRSPWTTRSPRGRAKVVTARRAGRWVRAELSCVGKTSGYCTGKLRLRHNGRPIGRPARYAVAAGPAAVRSRSARWLRIPRKLHSRGGLAVAGVGKPRAVR